MDVRKLVFFDIQTRDNIHRYQCNNPILSGKDYMYKPAVKVHWFLGHTQKQVAQEGYNGSPEEQLVQGINVIWNS